MVDQPFAPPRLHQELRDREDTDRGDPAYAHLFRALVTRAERWPFQAGNSCFLNYLRMRFCVWQAFTIRSTSCCER